METWDNAQPDRDRTIRGGSGTSEGGSETAGPTPDELEAESAERPENAELELSESTELGLELPELHRALSAVADAITAPSPDMYPKVMARAVRIRRRRRAVRAGSAMAVLVMAAVLGPSVASQLGVHGGDASAAPPPAAIVDLTSAYPVPQADVGSTAMATPTTQPGNALAWPSRGAEVPAQAVDVAKSYLLNHATNAVTATVIPVWAQVDEDSKAPAAHKTWLYVMQGWTVASDGAPSKAELLVGDYTQTGKTSSMSVYATPVTFAHARPGSADSADDARQIAELSVWLPQSGRLVVLGAPQTKTVLYAAVGADLVPQKTADGVAVFPRTRRLVKGHYADAIQVRDANNVALTPPKAWSAADFQLTGAGSLWTSGSGGGGDSGGWWVKLPARAGGREEATGPGVPAPSPVASVTTAR